MSCCSSLDRHGCASDLMVGIIAKKTGQMHIFSGPEEALSGDREQAHEGGKAANMRASYHHVKKTAQTQPIHAPPTTLSAECGGSAWATRATSRPPTASRWPRPPAARRRRRPPPVIRHRSRADLRGDRAEARRGLRRIGRHRRPI